MAGKRDVERCRRGAAAGLEGRRMEGDTAAVSKGNERGGRGWELVEAETDAAGNLLE